MLRGRILQQVRTLLPVVVLGTAASAAASRAVWWIVRPSVSAFKLASWVTRCMCALLVHVSSYGCVCSLNGMCPQGCDKPYEP